MRSYDRRLSKCQDKYSIYIIFKIVTLGITKSVTSENSFEEYYSFCRVSNVYTIDVFAFDGIFLFIKAHVKLKEQFF